MASVEHPAFDITAMPTVASFAPRASKFTAPQPPASYVARAALAARLDNAAGARLTVVTGRVGSGKTALLATWVATLDEGDRAWITLDADDNTASTFWGDIDTALAQLGRDERAGFNGKHTWRDAFLVLDDAHALTTDDAHHGLAELVALLPQWMHLVVACRGQLPLALWRNRTAGELVEIGDDDLRLSATEAEEIVDREPDLGITERVAFVARAEGWITGLKLMTSARRANLDDRVAVREFFLDEVFAHQPADVRTFLLEASVPELLIPGLSEAVTGRADAADVLHRLERANLFVSRMPGKYGTYRLHPQFRSMLCEEHEARHPDRVLEVHRAAAQWFQEHDDPDAAVEHWLAAGNVAEAVRLLPEARFTVLDANRDDLVRSLLARIHPSMGSADVWRLMEYATALAIMEQDAPLLEVLDHVDAILTIAPDDAAAFRAAFLRGMHAVGLGDVEGMVTALERAQAILDAHPDLAHDPRLAVRPHVSRLSMWLAHGYRWKEQPRAAGRTLTRIPPATLDRPDVHFLHSTRASIAFANGRLVDASHWAARANERATRLGITDDLTVRAARIVTAGLMCEQDDLDGARSALEALIQERAGPPHGVFAIRTEIQLAEVLRAQCDVPAALEILFRLRQQRVRTPGSAIDNMLTRGTVLCLLSIGRVDAARITLGAPPYAAPLLTTAALVELADDQPEIASDLLAAVRVDTPRRLLCVSLLRARIAASRADTAGVERHLRRALRLARREGFVHTFVTLAPDLVDHLPTVCATPEDADYAARLRRAKGRTIGVVDAGRSTTMDTKLSARELEVLSYMPTQLSAREIAHALHVSLNTVKTHMRNVYRKLDCGTREAAVEHARRLQLLH